MNIIKTSKIILPTSEQIIEYIRNHGQARAHDLCRVLGISNVAIHKQLRKLYVNNILKKIGKPPLVLYVLPDTSRENLLELEQIKNKIFPILKHADVTKAALFGSYVRGDNTAVSDIDILVDLPRGKTLFDLVGLKQDLEETLNKKVDIVTYNGIHPLLKKYILPDQYPIL